jgi:hypothetical protein
VRKRRIFLLLFFSSLSLLPIAAQVRAQASGVVGSIEAGVGADTSLKGIVSGALSVQLARRQARLEIVELSDVPQSARAPEGLSKAAIENAQYLLLGEYTTSPKSFTLAIDLYDVKTKLKVRTITATGRIDLTLDSVVADALDRTLSGIEFKKVVSVKTSTPESTSETAPGPTPAATVVTPVAGFRGQPVRTLFSLSSGVAPFILMGGASTYASLGILATFAADLRFPLGPGVFGAGLLSGLCALDAAGAVTNAQVLIVPIGADLRYSMNEGGFPGIVIHVSGGPAMMNVTADYAGSLTKLVPYLLAGMSLELPFASFIGLSISADWAAFFESVSLPLMAFAPEVSLYVRF